MLRLIVSSFSFTGQAEDRSRKTHTTKQKPIKLWEPLQRRPERRKHAQWFSQADDEQFVVSVGKTCIVHFGKLCGSSETNHCGLETRRAQDNAVDSVGHTGSQHVLSTRHAVPPCLAHASRQLIEEQSVPPWREEEEEGVNVQNCDDKQFFWWACSRFENKRVTHIAYHSISHRIHK